MVKFFFKKDLVIIKKGINFAPALRVMMIWLRAEMRSSLKVLKE